MQEPDTRPGFYYVTVRDAGRTGLLLGPYDKHESALARVEAARRYASDHVPFGGFYAYGTSRAETDLGPGKLNDLIGL